MPNEELLGWARSLIDDPATGAILRQVGVNGDMSEELEEYVSDHVIAAVERYGWERPHPGNLLIPVALARRFAAGSIDRTDTTKALAFIEDRRCEIADPLKSAGKPARVSEILPILKALDKREDLNAPYEKARQRTLKRGDDDGRPVRVGAALASRSAMPSKTAARAPAPTRKKGRCERPLQSVR